MLWSNGSAGAPKTESRPLHLPPKESSFIGRWTPLADALCRLRTTSSLRCKLAGMLLSDVTTSDRLNEGLSPGDTPRLLQSSAGPYCVNVATEEQPQRSQALRQTISAQCGFNEHRRRTRPGPSQLPPHLRSVPGDGIQYASGSCPRHVRVSPKYSLVEATGLA